MFDFQKYTAEERYSLLIKYRKFAKFITNQNINLIFAVVGMTDSVRNWYKKNIPNYIEIYIKADLKKLLKLKRKKYIIKKIQET